MYLYLSLYLCTLYLALYMYLYLSLHLCTLYLVLYMYLYLSLHLCTLYLPYTCTYTLAYTYVPYT